MPSGLLVVDKPAGLTSHDVVARVRRLLDTRRVGHAGTLDPLATGILLVCAGQATRLVEYLVGLDKTYEVVIRLGQTTTTYDAEGEVVEERPVDVTAAEVAAALAGFRGDIQQRPPVYSAIKQGGQPLYKLARRGESVTVPPRDVTIHALDLLAFDAPLLTLRVACSSGTYIRSLAHDLGETLGCGGHVVALRRTAVGDFTLADATPLDALTPANLRPPEAAVRHLPRLDLTAEEARRLALGQRLVADPARLPASPGRAHDPDGRLVGIVSVRDDVWQPEKILAQ